MGPMKLYFDVRDIFRAPRLALSGKKIFIFTLAGVIGYAAFWLLAYFAMAVSGIGLGTGWEQYGLYPFMGCSSLTIFGKLLYWAGTLILFYAISLGCTAVARVTYKQLKGDEFYSAGDAFKYVKKHWHPVIFTWISFVLILLFFLIGAAVFALFGYIPFIGEFLFVLPYLLYFFGSLFTVYTAVVFLISFIYTPAIVAVYEEDTMGAVFQSYSITWSQPWRIVLYHAVLLPIAMVGIHLFKFFWVASYKLVNVVFGMDWFHSIFGLEWFTSGKLANITNWAWNAVNPFALCADKTDHCYGTTHICSSWSFCTWFDMSTVPTNIVLSGTEYAAGVILAIFLFLLMVSVISYGLSIFSVGEVLMFVIFKKKTDDDNLLERKDEEELEDEDEESDENFADENDEENTEDDSTETDPEDKDADK